MKQVSIGLFILAALAVVTVVGDDAVADPYKFIHCRTECLRRQSICATICNKLCAIFTRQSNDDEECGSFVSHCHRCWSQCQGGMMKCFPKCYPDHEQGKSASRIGQEL